MLHRHSASGLAQVRVGGDARALLLGIVRAGRPRSRGASSTHKTGNMVRYIMPRNGHKKISIPCRPPTPSEVRDPPGSAGVPPASLFLYGSVTRLGSQPACRCEPQRPNRERPPASGSIQSGGDGRGCASALCGRDARAPGGHHPHIRPGTWFTSCQGIGQEAWFSAQESLPP